MGRSSGFTFKQFHIDHDRCAMKVGTDGILLGAWAPVADARRVLDIGTGSGLIALMLAQRSTNDCRIDGVELDKDAAEQARDNVAASPWASRVTIIENAIQDYQAVPYDLIVSNPPYFLAGQVFSDPARALARHTGALGPHALLAARMKFYASRQIMICTAFVIQLLSPGRGKRQIAFYCYLAED